MSYREALDRARKLLGEKAHVFIAYDGTHVAGAWVYDSPYFIRFGRYGWGLMIYREGASWDAVFETVAS